MMHILPGRLIVPHTKFSTSTGKARESLMMLPQLFIDEPRLAVASCRVSVGDYIQTGVVGVEHFLTPLRICQIIFSHLL